MSEIELLSWARGPGLQMATVILVAGVIIRVLEIVMLGRKPNLAEPKGSEMASGLRAIVMRSLPSPEDFKRAGFTTISGFAFHLGLFVILLFFAPHIEFFKGVFGFGWPALPTPIIDAVTVVTIITLLAIIVRRFNNKVLKFLNTKEDVLVWFVTIAPLVTGYLAFHRIGMSGPMLLVIHLLSVELLMVLLPFTKLAHSFTIFMARWYNGAISGYRGVQS